HQVTGTAIILRHVRIEQGNAIPRRVVVVLTKKKIRRRSTIRRNRARRNDRDRIVPTEKPRHLVGGQIATEMKKPARSSKKDIPRRVDRRGNGSIRAVTKID